MFPNLMAVQVVTDQPIAAEENEHMLTVTGGSRRGWATCGLMKLFDAARRSGLLPKHLAGLRIQGNRREFLFARSICGRNEFAAANYGCKVPRINRHSPAQDPGQIEVTGQMTRAPARNSPIRTKVLCWRGSHRPCR